MLKDRAQQVVLACATFDESGRLLVSQGGLLPAQTITRQFHQRVCSCLQAHVSTANDDRLSTTNSPPRIQSSNGCSGYPVTGLASLNSYRRCENTYNSRVTYRRSRQLRQATAEAR
jgi:hypothetical protein